MLYAFCQTRNHLGRVRGSCHANYFAPDKIRIGLSEPMPPQKPPDEELENIRLFVETNKLDVITDELREIVENFLPDLRNKLPPKKD